MFRMKSLRLGNFRSILEMLGPDGHDEEDAAATPASAPPHRRRPSAFDDALGCMPEDRRERRYIPLDRLARLYGEERPDESEPPPVWPADEPAIAAELHLAAARTGEDLRRIRRNFAMCNHPDRVPAWLRDEATRRMTIANSLIDRAMRERRKQKKSFF